MQGFVTKIVNLMKENQLFAWQGGPIIMAQVGGGESIIGQSWRLHFNTCNFGYMLQFHRVVPCGSTEEFVNVLRVQIENEYGNIEWEFGAGGKRYIQWAAEMALSLDARIPWIMCQQGDAPGDIVRPALIVIKFLL